MTAQTITPQDAAAFVMPFDRYQGKTLGWIQEHEPGYLRWLAKQMRPTHEISRQIQAMAQLLLGAPQPGSPPSPKPNGKARNNGHSSTASPSRPNPQPSRQGDRKPEDAPRIFSLVTNRAILHLEDALAIGKVKFFMVAYQRGQGASATVTHYVDVDDARVLAAELATGRLAQRYVEYKGSPTGREGQPLSRVLRVGDRGDKPNRPVVIQVQNGPGQLMGEGAIKPAGDPDAEVTIFLTRWEARRLGHALQHYILAWETARMLRGGEPC